MSALFTQFGLTLMYNSPQNITVSNVTDRKLGILIMQDTDTSTDAYLTHIPDLYISQYLCIPPKYTTLIQ